MSLFNETRMDKTVLTVASLHEPSDENEYWHQQTPEARLAALELMRQVMYGDYSPTDRLQRVLTVAQQIGYSA